MGSNEESERFNTESFRPTFSASKLGELCSPRAGEITKIKFIKQFQPFCQIKVASGASDSKKPASKINKVLLTQKEKEEIKLKLDAEIDYKELKFDDDSLIEAFENDLKLQSASRDPNELSFLMNNLLITDDSDADDSGNQQNQQAAYLTAESDEEYFKRVNKKFTNEEIIEMKSKQAVRYVSNMRGRKLEKHILDKINKSNESQQTFVQMKTKKTVDYGKFKIVGIIDGISTDNTTILEIKTRKNFSDDKNSITNKERLQAFTYMNMFNCNCCLFVECGPGGQIKKTTIRYDEKVFNDEILSRLERFCQYAKAFDQNNFKSLLIKYQIFE
jgi:hypothetical protein